MGNHLKQFVIAILSVFVLSACTIGGAAFQKVGSIKQDEAVVYLYRPQAFVGGGVMYDIYANGQKLTTLVHTSYVPYVAPAGNITFRAQTAVHGYQTVLDIKTEPGKIYYVRGGTDRIKGGHHLPTLTLVSNEVGEAEIARCVRY